MKTNLIPALAAGAGLVALLIGSNPAMAATGPELAQKHACMACHSVDKKVLGPAFKDIGKKYGGNADALAKVTKSISAGSSGVWGPIPMPANSPRVPDADIKALAEWIVSLK